MKKKKLFAVLGHKEDYYWVRPGQAAEEAVRDFYLASTLKNNPAFLEDCISKTVEIDPAEFLEKINEMIEIEKQELFQLEVKRDEILINC